MKKGYIHCNDGCKAVRNLLGHPILIQRKFNYNHRDEVS